MTNKERLKESTEILKNWYGLDTSKLAVPQICNIIGLCNSVISLRYSIEKSEREGYLNR